MFDLSAISSAKKKAEINQEKLVDNYEVEFAQGLKILENFTENFDSGLLKQASEKFFNALKYKRTNVEPYFYIAYAFFMYEETEMAYKYLEFAEEVDITFPHLKKLRELIEAQ